MAESDGIHMCFDRVIPDEYAPARATLTRALERRGELDSTAVETSRAAIVLSKMWEPDSVLKVRFLDGSATQQQKVEGAAKGWETYAGITFDFVTSDDEQIRVSFEADASSWSAVGTDALIERYFPRYQPTMNFGWLKDNSDDEEVSRVVLHEFGHALGCIHEHQSPESGLRWNEAEVLRVFSGAPNFWTQDQIEHNVLMKYGNDNINATDFDPDSIMLYEFPANLFLDGEGTKSNTQLSDNDKAFIASQYPKAD